jgi:hypothetical protein
MLLLVLALAAAGPAAAQDGAASRDDKPYSELVRRAISTYYPQVLRGASRGTVYLWFIGDGRGRIVGHRMSGDPPRSMMLRDAIREHFPRVDPVHDAEAVPDAAFPNAGNSLHPPGEMGPDSVWVFWSERPFRTRDVPPQAGPFSFGRAASQQIAPPPVRRLAAEAVTGDVVWYVYSDEQPLLDSGLYTGLARSETNPDAMVAAVRAVVRQRFPDGELTCSLGSSLPNRDGTLVSTLSVRYQPPRR